jgi:iron-sulfur cluster repair protein YtfE (RIC family)
MNELTVQASFAEDHDRLDALLETYRRLKRTDFPRAKGAFKAFKTGLQRHIVWEEQILFPRFEEKTGMREFGPTAVMRAEHRQIGACLEALHQKVRQQDPDSDIEEAHLLDLLAAHNHKEEQILYPSLDRLLSPQEQAAVRKEMEEVPEEAYRTCFEHIAQGER